VAATRLVGEQAAETSRQWERGDRGGRPFRRADLGQRSPAAAGRRHRVDPERLLGVEPRRQAPGRRRDWQAARAALERLAGWDRHRDHRSQPHPDRTNRDRRSRVGGRNERDGR
jgi:hypothetical protein